MLAVLHGIYGDGSVKLPGDGEIDEVYVVEFAELLIAFFTGELMYGTRGAVLLKDRLCPVDAVLIKVAEGHKGCILKIRETVDGTGTAVSEAYKADPDVLDGLGPESEHGLLVCRTRRNVIDNLVVLDGVAVRVLAGTGEGKGRDGEENKEFLHTESILLFIRASCCGSRRCLSG
jgi:hypothetical protein